MLGVFTWPVRSGCPLSDSAHRPRPAPVATYVLACTLAGAFTAAAVGSASHFVRSLGSAPASLVYAMAAALFAVAALAQFHGTVAPLPQRERQVPRHWLQWRRTTATAAAFGFMIGSGALTYLQFAAAYAVLASIIIAPSFLSGVVIGALYGLTRGGTLFATWAGDRFMGRRPDWERLAAEKHAVDVALGLAAVVFPAIAVLVTVSQ